MQRTSVTELHRLVLPALLVTLCLSLTSVSAQTDGRPGDDTGPATPALPDDAERLTLVYLNRPVRGVVDTLEALFESSDGLLVVTDVDANIVILRGSAAVTEKAVRLLKQVDRPPRLLRFDVSIAVFSSAQDDDSPRVPLQTDTFQLATLSESSAAVQVGQQVQIASGVQMSSGGRSFARSYQQENVGTLVKVDPRKSEQSILVDLTVEKSWLESALADNTSEVDSAPRSTVYNSTLQTTLDLTPGQSQTAKASVSGGTNSGREVEITISAAFAEPSSTQTNSAPQQSGAH
ncbi:MAG: hypothetical protein RIK87_22870 [Fuerstiella sp.]